MHSYWRPPSPADARRRRYSDDPPPPPFPAPKRELEDWPAAFTMLCCTQRRSVINHLHLTSKTRDGGIKEKVFRVDEQCWAAGKFKYVNFAFFTHLSTPKCTLLSPNEREDLCCPSTPTTLSQMCRRMLRHLPSAFLLSKRARGLAAQLSPLNERAGTSSPHPLSKRVGVDFITYHHPLRSPNDHEMSARPTPPNVREGISSPTCTHLHIGSANEREGSLSPRHPPPPPPLSK